jgi:CheY-like chemotaxis protein
MTKRDAVEILLVEDDPNDVELALLALKKNGRSDKVQVVRDGEEALDFLFCRGPHEKRNPSCPPKIVLLDLKLPKITGVEVLKEIKSDHRTRPIPVAVLTSSKEESDMMVCYQLGANSYIQKPINFEHFQRTIDDLGYYWLAVNQSLASDTA